MATPTYYINPFTYRTGIVAATIEPNLQSAAATGRTVIATPPGSPATGWALKAIKITCVPGSSIAETFSKGEIYFFTVVGGSYQYFDGFPLRKANTTLTPKDFLFLPSFEPATSLGMSQSPVVGSTTAGNVLQVTVFGAWL